VTTGAFRALLTYSLLYLLRLKCREYPHFKPLGFVSPSLGVRFSAGQRSQRAVGHTVLIRRRKCSKCKPMDVRVQTPILLPGGTKVAAFKPEVGCQPYTLLVVPENGSQGLWAEWVIPYPSTSLGTQTFLLIHSFPRIKFFGKAHAPDPVVLSYPSFSPPHYPKLSIVSMNLGMWSSGMIPL